MTTHALAITAALALVGCSATPIHLPDSPMDASAPDRGTGTKYPDAGADAFGQPPDSNAIGDTIPPHLLYEAGATDAADGVDDGPGEAGEGGAPDGGSDGDMGEAGPEEAGQGEAGQGDAAGVDLAAPNPDA